MKFRRLIGYLLLVALSPSFSAHCAAALTDLSQSPSAPAALIDEIEPVSDPIASRPFVCGTTILFQLRNKRAQELIEVGLAKDNQPIERLDALKGAIELKPPKQQLIDEAATAILVLLAENSVSFTIDQKLSAWIAIASETKDPIVLKRIYLAAATSYISDNQIASTFDKQWTTLRDSLLANSSLDQSTRAIVEKSFLSNFSSIIKRDK